MNQLRFGYGERSDEKKAARRPKALPHSGSDTSTEAAQRAMPRAGSDALMVFMAIRERGARGATCDELEESLQMQHQTCSARINGLVRKGLVKDSGECRQTRSGRPARVLKV